MTVTVSKICVFEMMGQVKKMMILCEKEITLFSYSRSFIRNLTSFGLVLAQCHN